MRRFPHITRVHVGLGLVVLFELALFADVHYQRWENVIAPLGQPPETAGAGLVIRGNGLGYYAWLRSLLIDGDWDFADEFDDYPVAGDYVPPPTYRTELGRRANQWSVGPACVWAVTVVPGHYLLKAFGDWSPWAADGYSLPYQLLAALASLAMSTLGLCFLYGICRYYARPSLAALAAAFMTLGSTIVYYNTAEVSMAHGIGAAVLAGLVWYWLKTFGSPSPWRWFAVGLLVGAAALVRWQLATFAVLPVAEALLRPWSRLGQGRTDFQSVPRSGKRIATLLLLSAAGAFLAFLPQMIAWHAVYGHWLVEPVPQIAHHWLTPSLWDLLLSQDRSLFYWTPICALAFLGFLLPTRSPRAEPLVLLFAAFGLQAYAVAAVWGKGELLREVGNFAGAFLSRAYGMRHLTEAVVVLAPGLALLLERAAGCAPSRLRGITPFRLLAAVAFVLALWNLTLVSQYNNRLLPADAGAAPRTLLANVLNLVETDRWTLLMFVEALGLLSLVLLWGQVACVARAGEASGPANGITPARPTHPTAAIRWCTFALLVIGTAAPVLWPRPSVGFLYRSYRDLDGRESRYALFIPHNYQADRSYPLLVYLHGSGPRRWDGTRPPQEPLATVIRDQESTFDMLAVFPQSATGAWEAGSPDLQRVVGIVAEVQAGYNVDPERLSLTGMSRGAFGVWSLAAAYPDKWAAIVPVCGGGNPQDAARIRRIPCWCFHGALDKVVAVDQSRRMIKALRDAGAAPRYHEYADLGHKCWERAFATPDLFPWLKGQRSVR